VEGGAALDASTGHVRGIDQLLALEHQADLLCVNALLLLEGQLQVLYSGAILDLDGGLAASQGLRAIDATTLAEIARKKFGAGKHLLASFGWRQRS